MTDFKTDNPSQKVEPEDSQERMNRLVAEVTSKKPEEVSFLTRAMVAVELTKDAIDQGKVSLDEGLEFAESLIDFNAVPVVVGTPECKLFPPDIIIFLRPAVIDNYKKASAKEGINLEEVCRSFKEKAQGISDLLEMGADWLSKKYGPFPLSPEQAQAEITSKVEASVAAKELLQGLPKPTQGQIEGSNLFMKLNFSNFIAGQDLQTYIKSRYQFK